MRPVKDYLKPQGRFRHLREPKVNFIQQHILDATNCSWRNANATYPEFPVVCSLKLRKDGIMDLASLEGILSRYEGQSGRSHSGAPGHSGQLQLSAQR